MLSFIYHNVILKKFGAAARFDFGEIKIGLIFEWPLSSRPPLGKA